MIEVHPWQSGPTELIEYGLKHLQEDDDFNRRIAFLLLDIGVETLLKTFLTLPDDVTKPETSYSDRKKASDGNFHDLIKGIKTAAASRLKDFDLSHIEFYHDLRNKLYHQGNGITVSVKNAIGYATDATLLLKRLLDIDLTDNVALKPNVLKKLETQVHEVQSAVNWLVRSAELVIEKIEPKLLFPSVIENLRGLAVGVDIHNLQEKVAIFISTVKGAVQDESIRNWLLGLVCLNPYEASPQALANTRFLFNLLDDLTTFYLLIIGTFVLPEGNIEKEFLYSEEDLEIIDDEEYHIVGIYNSAKTFLQLWAEPKGYRLKSSVLDGLVENGKVKVQELGTISDSFREWVASIGANSL